MDGKDKNTTSTAAPSFSLGGQEQTEAMRKMQKEFLDACEQASRAWLARAQSEANFWAELSSKLGATKSLPEAFETYQKSMTQRMQMASEDSRRMMEDYQKIMGKMTQPGKWKARRKLMIARTPHMIGTAGSTPAEQMRDDPAVVRGRYPSCEWAGLIRKLRWIGLEEEARRLETAVSALPPEERGSVSVGPFSTD